MAARTAFENLRIYRLAEEIADLVESGSIKKKQQTTNNDQLTLPQFLAWGKSDEGDEK